MALRGNDKSEDKEGCYAVFTKSDRAVELAMEEDDDALVCTGIRTTAEAMEEDGFVITGSKPADEGELTMTEMYKRQITYIEYHERQIREQREQAELNERLARQAEQRARQAVRFAEREKARELEREKDREAEREKDRERARREQREAAKVAVAEDVRASVAKRGLLEPPPPAEDDMKCVRVDLAQTFAAAAAVAAAVAAVTADAAASAVELIGQQQQQEEAAHQQQQQQQEEGGQQQQQQQPEAEEKKAGEKKDEKEEEEEEKKEEKAKEKEKEEKAEEKEKEAVEEEDAWDHTWEVEADRIAQKSKKRGEILNESFVDHKDGDKLKHVVKVVKSDTTTAHGVLALAKELMPEVEFKSNSSKKVWTVRCVVESDDAAREVENLFRAYFGLEQTPF